MSVILRTKDGSLYTVAKRYSEISAGDKLSFGFCKYGITKNRPNLSATCVLVLDGHSVCVRERSGENFYNYSVRVELTGSGLNWEEQRPATSTCPRKTDVPLQFWIEKLDKVDTFSNLRGWTIPGSPHAENGSVTGSRRLIDEKEAHNGTPCGLHRLNAGKR